MISIKKKRRGFTLIEMVVVITIIGILSSIAVGQYSKVQDSAKKNADYATASNLASAAMISIAEGNESIDPASLQKNGYIQFEPISKTEKQGFVVTKEGDDVVVKSGSNTYYPKQDKLESES